VILLSAKTVPGNAFFPICIPPPLGSSGCGDGPRFKQIDQVVDSVNSLVLLQSHIGAVESFMRPGSVRHFVEVSDDNSDSVITAQLIDSFLRNRGGFADYVFHSIVGQPSSPCADATGSTYIALSQMTSGSLFDICTADWKPLFDTLGKQVAAAVTLYKLTEQPMAGTLSVSFDGKPVQQGTSWVHDAQNNQIVLKGNLPPAGTMIEACYKVPL